MLRIIFPLIVIRSLSLLVFISLVASLAEAEKKSKSEIIEYRGGIRNSNGQYRLEAKQLALLLASLQEKTGFTELSVDSSVKPVFSCKLASSKFKYFGSNRYCPLLLRRPPRYSIISDFDFFSASANEVPKLIKINNDRLLMTVN